jgi:hypothetical protein
MEQKMEWHLRGNCYPPVPMEFIPLAVTAIEHANVNQWDVILEYPNGIRRDVRHTIEGLFLEPFVGGGE